MLLASLGFERNYFLTFNQVQQLGGKVKKGEKSLIVLYWKHEEKTDEETGEIEGREKAPRRILRYYSVFNIEQCLNIPEEKIPEEIIRSNDPYEECETVVKNMPHKPAIKHKGRMAYYDPTKDVISMPEMKHFTNSDNYYGTLFHELIHSTGHAKRLSRKELIEMGKDNYSIEELTAEIGSCYMQSHTGITTDMVNSAAYINGWLEKLQSNMRYIVYASAQAQRATDFILGLNANDNLNSTVSMEGMSNEWYNRSP